MRFRRFRSAILAGFVAGLLAAGQCRAADAKPPYEIIRSLESLHDQMVLGSRPAQMAMPTVLRQLGARLVAADPSVWHDPRNARAVVIYLLSGGEIRVARKILASNTCPAAERQLIEGSLAYLEGYKSQARNLLAKVDVRALEPGVGSHIALAQAALAAEEKPEVAIQLLDLARIVAPGTLVEDAALRREVFLAEQTSDFDKFIAMSDQYFRRFKRSVYASAFQRDFGIALTRLSQFAKPEQLAALSALLKELPDAEQLRFYLHVAQVAVVGGKTITARWAAAEAAGLAPKSGPDAVRAALYDGVAALLSSEYDRGLAEIKAVDPAHLPHEDTLLRDASLDLAAQIHQWPQQPPVLPGENTAAQAEPPMPVASTLPANLGASMHESDSTISDVQKMLVDSSALLEGQD
ncbi:MAG: hypothetical protein ACLP8A_14090 [Methylovirgula sp.]